MQTLDAPQLRATTVCPTRGLGSADRVLLCARERKSRRVSPLRRGATNARNGLETLGLGRRVPELLGGGDSVRARVDAELAHDV